MLLVIISLSELEHRVFFKIIQNSPRPSGVSVLALEGNISKTSCCWLKGSFGSLLLPKGHLALLNPARAALLSLRPTVAPAAQHSGGCVWRLCWAACSMIYMFCKIRLCSCKFSLRLWLIYERVWKTGPTGIRYPLPLGQVLWIGLYSTQLFSFLTAVKCFCAARPCK